MTFTVLDSDKLAQLSNDDAKPGRAKLSMVQSGRAFLTTVHVDVQDITFCLYAETHAEPRVADSVLAAVTEFNAGPAEWERLVAEALDAQAELLEEDRAELDERAARISETRKRLLH